MPHKRSHRIQILATTQGDIIGAAGVGIVKIGKEEIASGIQPRPGQMLHEVEVPEEFIKLMWNPEAFYRWTKDHYLTCDGQLKGLNPRKKG